MHYTLKLISILFFLIYSTAFCFSQTRVNLEKLYFGSDIFMPFANDTKNLEFELAYASFGWPHELTFNYKAAYSPKKNLAIKLNYRNNIVNGSGSHLISMHEGNLGLGFYKSFSTNRAKDTYAYKMEKLENRFKPRKLSRLKWRNSWRESKGKTPVNLKNKFLRQESILISAYVGYGSSFINGHTYIFSGSERLQIKTANYSLERFNGELGITCITAKRFSIAYYLRSSFINFKNIKYFNPSSDLVTSFEILEPKDPFSIFESNFKVAFYTKKLEYFMKFNDIIGRSQRRFNTQIDLVSYQDLNYNFSINLGVTFNL